MVVDTEEPGFRLVLPQNKRDRLRSRIASLVPRRACSAPGCGAPGLAVVLVEPEQEAVLCPRHKLVDLDGTPLAGEPMLAMASWAP
jgi:hypothetical protein